MQTSPVEHWRSQSQAGFTLLELIVVLAILALTSGAIMYSSSSSLGTARFRSLLVNTSAMLAEGRTDAIKNMRERVFRVDVRNRRLGYLDRKEAIVLPPGVELRAVLAASETWKDGTNGIRFYPSGGSSGGTLTFSYQGSDYEIRVNWLTGNVSTHRI
jgi:general secretion pathway protein H